MALPDGQQPSAAPSQQEDEEPVWRAPFHQDPPRTPQLARAASFSMGDRQPTLVRSNSSSSFAGGSFVGGSFASGVGGPRRRFLSRKKCEYCGESLGNFLGFQGFGRKAEQHALVCKVLNRRSADEDEDRCGQFLQGLNASEVELSDTPAGSLACSRSDSYAGSFCGSSGTSSPFGTPRGATLNYGILGPALEAVAEQQQQREERERLRDFDEPGVPSGFALLASSSSAPALQTFGTGTRSGMLPVALEEDDEDEDVFARPGAAAAEKVDMHYAVRATPKAPKATSTPSEAPPKSPQPQWLTDLLANGKIKEGTQARRGSMPNSLRPQDVALPGKLDTRRRRSEAGPGCVFESHPTAATASASSTDKVVSPRRSRGPKQRATILPTVRSRNEGEVSSSAANGADDAEAAGTEDKPRRPLFGADDENGMPALSRKSTHAQHDMSFEDTPRANPAVRRSSIVEHYSALNENGSSEEELLDGNKQRSASWFSRPAAVTFAITEDESPTPDRTPTADRQDFGFDQAKRYSVNTEVHQLSSDDDDDDEDADDGGESSRGLDRNSSEKRLRSTSIQMRYDALGGPAAEPCESSGSEARSSPARSSPLRLASPVRHAFHAERAERASVTTLYALDDSDEQDCGGDDTPKMGKITSLAARYASLDASRHDLADGDSPRGGGMARNRFSSINEAYEALDGDEAPLGGATGGLGAIDERLERGRQGSTASSVGNHQPERGRLGSTASSVSDDFGLVPDLGSLRRESGRGSTEDRDLGSLSPGASPRGSSGRSRRRFQTAGHSRFVAADEEEPNQGEAIVNRKKVRAMTAPTPVVARVPEGAKKEHKRASCEVVKGHTLRLAGAHAKSVAERLGEDLEALAASQT